MSVPLKSIPVIEREEVEKYLDFESLFNGLEKAFASFSKKEDEEVIQPVRSVVPVDKYQG